MSKIVINNEQLLISEGDQIVTQLGGLSDVDLTGLTDQEILVFNQGSGLWQAQDINTLVNTEIETQDDGVTINSATTTLNFTGDGVIVTDSGLGVSEINISASGIADTDALSEGVVNLYYTDARVDTRFATKTTTDLTEGTNLYFTDERVDDRVNDLLVAGSNIVLNYDDVANSLTISAASGGGGTTMATSPTPPILPSNGEQWWNTTNNKKYVYYEDGDSGQWVEISDSASVRSIMSDTVPVGAVNGDQWWNTATGKQYIYYVDIDSAQWVEVTHSSTIKSTIDTLPPPDAVVGTLWFNNATGKLYILYNDGDSVQWIQI